MNEPILIIEDNPTNLYMLTFILEKHGYRVLQAENGEEGITVARKQRPALILLDIELPVMDGYEVARQLKDDPECRDIPIVAVTSHAMVGDRERILAMGCEGYIEKPINLETFLDEMARHL